MGAGDGAGGEVLELRGGNSIPRARKTHCARVSAGAWHCMTEGLKDQWAPLAAAFRTEVRRRSITDCQECGEPGREECGGRRDRVCGEVSWVGRTLICGKTNRKPLCMDWVC